MEHLALLQVADGLQDRIDLGELVLCPVLFILLRC
jgi:hypothetical protein